jgi:hypothetical protein
VLVIAAAAIASPSAREHGGADHHHDQSVTATGATPLAAAAGDHHAGDASHDAAHDAGPATTPTSHVAGAGNPIPHGHAVDTYVPLDSATARTFSAEMQLTRDATMQYPTIADAKRDGLRPVGIFSAGSGAHYMVPNPTGRLTFDAAKPLMWLFAGNEDTSPVVGVMHFSFAGVDPEGYAGPNDHWHQHSGLCLKYGAGGVELPLPIDQDATAAQCAAVGGQFMASTGYMIHVWSAPGWESPKGPFSHDNELLVCADGRTAGEVQLNEGCEGLA